jgi:hypothetical protein
MAPAAHTFLSRAREQAVVFQGSGRVFSIAREIALAKNHFHPISRNSRNSVTNLENISSLSFQST